MLQDHSQEVASIRQLCVLDLGAMLDNAGNLVNLLSLLKHEETCLATLLELLNILPDATLHRLHELVKIALGVSDDN